MDLPTVIAVAFALLALILAFALLMARLRITSLNSEVEHQKRMRKVGEEAFNAVIGQRDRLYEESHSRQAERDKARAERDHLRRRLTRVGIARRDALKRIVRLESQVTSVKGCLRDFAENL